MKKTIKVLSIAVTLFFTASIAQAQFGGGGPVPGGGGGTPIPGSGGGTPAVPFDGGMSIMLAASGIGYAAKKLRRNTESNLA